MGGAIQVIDHVDFNQKSPVLKHFQTLLLPTAINVLLIVSFLSQISCPVTVTHLGESCAEPPARRASGLNEHVLIVNEWPRPLHDTRLEAMVEGSDVWVSKHTAVQVLRGPALPAEEAPLVEARIS